jgi:hypothetical protein
MVASMTRIEDKAPLKIWLDTRTNEPGWERARELRDRMVEKGWRLGDDLEYLEVEGGDHSQAAWASRFEAVLRYLFLHSRRARNSRRPGPGYSRPWFVSRPFTYNRRRFSIRRSNAARTARIKMVRTAVISAIPTAAVVQSLTEAVKP